MAILFADNGLYPQIYDTLFFDYEWLKFGALALLFIGISGLGSFYQNITRETTLHALTSSLASAILTTALLAWLVIKVLDADIRYVYPLFYTFATALFAFSSFTRIVLIWRRYLMINTARAGYNTIIIGSNNRSLKLYNELVENAQTNGNILIGFVDNISQIGPLSKQMQHLGPMSELSSILAQYQVDEIIVTSKNILHLEIQNAIRKANLKGVVIRVMPEMKSILSGVIRTTDIFGPNLVTLKNDLMPRWQRLIKWLMDVCIAVLSLLFLSPLMVVIALLVWTTSKGAVIYSQQRIGQHGIPFKIYKFRSMTFDSEFNGPALSSANDPRITKVGRFLRKWRLDEIPQFWNVILGQMSLVGPRPERQFYINQLLEKIPHYQYLFMVKPGITSWGMVKYGYAQNLGEMVVRTKYDIIYIENMSLLVDFKIIIYTFKTIILGRGK